MSSPKMLTLEELQQMSASQQDTTGQVIGPDGKPTKRVETRDLSPKTQYAEVDLSGAVDAQIRALDQAANAMQNDQPDITPTPSKVYQPPASTAALQKQKLHAVNPADIAPPEEVKVVGETIKNKWMNDLDTALDRDKQRMWDNVIAPLYEEQLEKALLEGNDSEPSLDLVGEDQTIDNMMMEEGDIDMDVVTNNQAMAPTNEFVIDDAPVATASEEINGVIPVEEDMMAEEIKMPVAPALNFSDFEEEEPLIAPATPVIDTETSQKTDDIPAQIPMDMPSSIDSDADISGLDLDSMFGRDDIDDDSIGESEVILSESDEKEEISKIQKVIRNQARPISNVINLSEYTIASKPTSSAKVLTSIEATKQVHSANWLLYNAGRSFTMSELYGQEIEKLDPSAETGLNELMRNRELYGIFYDHIVDGNKPASFEAWAKGIPYDDVRDLYFGVYRASFSHTSNLLPYTCLNARCKHSFMEHKPINSLVKFKDDAAKARSKSILASDPTTASLSIVSKLFQVSNDICISFRTPSIYSVVFETASLPQKFRDKYKDLVYYINCIENIYQIDSRTKTLLRMETKVEPGDIVKTVTNKYKTYAAILQKLSPDEYFAFPSYLKELNPDRSGEVTFEIPETICPKCGKPIKASPMDAISLLFTRLRLQVILAL